MPAGAGASAGHLPWLRVSDNCVVLRVRAKPGSSRDGVIRLEADALVIGLHSPPEKGRANEELIEVVARAAGVARSAVTISRGTTARQKQIQIATPDAGAVSARLLEFARTR